MSRLVFTGFELNSVTDREEFGVGSGSGGSSVTTPIRSGAYAIRGNPVASTTRFALSVSSGDTTGPYFARVYFRIATLPDADAIILAFRDAANTDQISIRLNTTGNLELWNEEDAAQIGSDSGVLATDTWYRIELKIDATTLAATVAEGVLDGVAFASGTGSLANGVDRINFGLYRTALSGDVFIEDLAVNSNTGSFENTYPGIGEIINLRPSATGDNSDWTGTNADIDEINPDDATTFITSNTLDQIEDVNIDDTPAGLDPNETIKVVGVGVRSNGAASSANASFVLRIKATSGGTVEESAEITGDLTWRTNDPNFATVREPRLILYNLPGSSTASWTKTELDTAQIGVRLSTASTNAIQVSTLWLQVEHTPGTFPSYDSWW